MPLDLDSTDPMYLLGRVVATLEGAYPDGRRVADTALIDTLLVRPAAGLALLLKAKGSLSSDGRVSQILDALPAAGMPKGPMTVAQQGPYWMGYYHQRAQERRDITIVSRFDRETLVRVGEALFGPDHWQAEMTRALGLGDTARVRAWLRDDPDKRRRVPAGVCHDLMVMLRQKSAAAKALADEIDGVVPGQPVL